MIRARSTRHAGSVRDRAIYRNCRRCAALLTSAITRRGAAMDPPTQILHLLLPVSPKTTKIKQHIDNLESLH
jgi:hypothetical protein